MNKTRCDKYSDEELAKLTLKKQDYFLCLMNRYEGRLFQYIHRLTNICHEDAEDLLQEIFIKTYQNLNDFDKSLKFSSWIYRIAHNQIISHWRKLESRPKTVQGDFNENQLDCLVSDLDISKEIDNKFFNNNIRQALAKLDVKYKEILVLRFFEDKSYDEISDIVKKPKGTVASLLNRAKKKLKEKIDYEKIN